MKRSIRKVFQGVFGALMLGALGFGATQALAAPPSSPAQAGFCYAAEQTACNQYCSNLYGPGKSLARCTRYPTGPSCSCTVL